jgi:hypothetical protein
MVELVEELQDAESELQLRDNNEINTLFGQDLGTGDHDLDVHDAGTVKLLVRVLRRHAELAPRFCQTAGKLVAYRAALQQRFMTNPEDSALTFDWVSEALLALDREQQPDIALAANSNAPQPAPGQVAAQPRGSIYSL